MEALKQYFSVKFVRLPDMLLALETAREEKNYPKALSKFIRPALLIIDEWLLMKVRPEDVNYIFEVIHKRCGHGSLILCSQFREEGWYDRLGVKDSPLADALWIESSILHFKSISSARIRPKIFPCGNSMV